MNLCDYLTKKEKQQMEDLMQKASERKQQNEEKADAAVSCMFWEMQYEAEKQANDEALKMKTDFEKDLRGVVDQVCGFFQKHGYCEIRKQQLEEDLPFD